jgi:hopanoid-associated phosphorylase
VTRLGVVTGLAAEARCLREAAPENLPDDALTVVCSGGDPARALAWAQALIENGVNALLSFGIAGGLDPALVAGDLVVGEAVVDPDGRRYQTDAVWRDGLLALLADQSPRRGAIASSERPVASPAGKCALHVGRCAAAVDMESHGVARAADAAGLPFAVIRAIADPAGRVLPHAALAGLGPDGEPRPIAVLAELVRRPWELPALFAVAADARRALATLGRCAVLGAPLFGRGGLG